MSKIKKLPDEIKQFIDKELKEGRLTQVEITLKARDMLRAIDADEELVFSEMSLSRYKRSLLHILESRQQAQMISEALVSKVGEEPEQDLVAVSVELMKNLVFNRIDEISKSGEQFSIDEANKLMLNLKRVSDTEQKSRNIARQAVKDYQERVKAELEKEIKEHGIKGASGTSEEMEEIIRRALTGAEEPTSSNG